jgi:predicted small lipoprotein YifL
MRKIITSVTALCLLALLNSCGEKAMDPAAVDAKVDSMAAAKIEAASASAIKECETRMATEVKFKTDSLVNAAQVANAPL